MKDYLIIAGLSAATGFCIGMIVNITISPRIEVDYYLDAEKNIICYTTANGGISCLPYNDEGTHLEVISP